MCQNLKQLKPVDLNEVWETEPHHFTPWLTKEENLTLLGKTLGIGLELETQEINVGDFRNLFHSLLEKMPVIRMVADP